MSKLFAVSALLFALFALAAHAAQAHGDQSHTPNAPAPASSTIICTDNTDGNSKRVQPLYLYPVESTSAYTTSVPTITAIIAGVDGIFAASSNDQRRVRFATLPLSFVNIGNDPSTDCALSIIPVAVPITVALDIAPMINYLQSIAYNSPDRKYLLFVDSTGIECATALSHHDSRPAPENQIDHTPGYAWLARPCWNAKAATHELLHTLGAVQYDAPHSTGGWHCTDEHDIMCYSDLPHYPPMTYPCADPAYEYRLDCGGDDYFSLEPMAPENYLASHWNIADSLYLARFDHKVHLPLILNP